MRTINYKNIEIRSMLLWSLLFAFLIGPAFVWAQEDYTEYKGKIVDARNHKAIPEVHLSVENTSITGYANSQGEFSLKVPEALRESVVSFSKLGYESKLVQLSLLGNDEVEITLERDRRRIEQLDEVEIYRGEDPYIIVQKMLRNRGKTEEKLAAFYRERIDRGRRNVMLGEAVVQIDEAKRMIGRKGEVSVYKSRKNTDYNRLDTVAVKLRGGPYSGLYLDLVNYPDFLFYENNFEDFRFSFDEPETIEGRYVYVINFENIDKEYPWYYGQLFIDAKTNSLVRAEYSLNVDNRAMARRMLVVQKPSKIKVTPLETHYRADYILKDGKWYFNYGNFNIVIRVNWKGRLFNSRYSVHTELAVTNRNENGFFSQSELKKIKPTVVMADDIRGFEDPDFWGSNNIIEPDRSIQEAIEMIQDKLKN